MDISFFGDYLLHLGLINSEQLDNAVDYQLKQNKSIGQIALDERLLNEDQIAKIKEIQRLEDKRFGEIAVDEGLLFSSQLEVILEKQKRVNLLFGDALDQLGYLDTENLDKLARKFLDKQKNKKTHIYTELAFCDKDHILDDSVSILKSLFYRSFQEHIKFKKVDLDLSISKETTYLFQLLYGDMEIEFILAFDSDLMKLSRLADKSKDEVIDLLCDLMKDLIKRVAINLSERDIIVKNGSCQILKNEEIDLSDFDQLKFVTTAAEIELFIKV